TQRGKQERRDLPGSNFDFIEFEIAYGEFISLPFMGKPIYSTNKTYTVFNFADHPASHQYYIALSDVAGLRNWKFRRVGFSNREICSA
ncbi:MAG: hypothetical protein B6D37_10655, partial [Sphingobacteriales bacterium UTBCD1]